MKNVLLLLVSILFISSQAMAGSVSILKGSAFTKDSKRTIDKETMSIDAAGDWKYGTIIFAYDIDRPLTSEDDEELSFGGIVTPLLSYKKMTGNSLPAYVKDAFLKYELEHSSNGTRINYYGFAFDFNVPFTSGITVETVLKDDSQVDGMGGQVNFMWNVPFQFTSQYKFNFKGWFVSQIFAEANANYYFVTQPQILLDLGNAIGSDKEKIYIGSEYALTYVKDAGDNNDDLIKQSIQAMVKVVF